MYTLFKKENGEFGALDTEQNAYELDFQDDLDESVFTRLNEGYGEIIRSNFSSKSSLFTNAGEFPELQNRGLVALHVSKSNG